MLVKIAHLLLLVVDAFNKELHNNQPWEIMLEGKKSLTFDLNKGPNMKQVMGFTLGVNSCQLTTYRPLKKGLLQGSLR